MCSEDRSDCTEHLARITRHVGAEPPAATSGRCPCRLAGRSGCVGQRSPGAAFASRTHVHGPRHDRRRRRRRLRRLDRAAPAPPRRARDPARRLGAGQLPRQLGRRDAGHPRRLRPRPRSTSTGWSRSFALWREAEARWRPAALPPDRRALDVRRRRRLRPRLAAAAARGAGSPSSELGLAEARAALPAGRFDGVRSVFFEPEAGYLLARRACQAVAERFVAEGGEYRELAVAPGADPRAARLARLALSDGCDARPPTSTSSPAAPGSAGCFPEVVGDARSGRPGRRSSSSARRPATRASARSAAGLDRLRRARLLRHPRQRAARLQGRRRHPRRAVRSRPRGERTPTPDAPGARPRASSPARFPDLAGAPLLESRVCQYENSPDGHFLLDRHPQAANVWLARRRLRPRLQARAGAGRARGRAGPRRRPAGPDVRAEAAGGPGRAGQDFESRTAERARGVRRRAARPARPARPAGGPASTGRRTAPAPRAAAGRPGSRPRSGGPASRTASPAAAPQSGRRVDGGLVAHRATST